MSNLRETNLKANKTDLVKKTASLPVVASFLPPSFIDHLCGATFWWEI
jgi:hypothetical protein